MGKYQLIYFKVRGRGQAIRYLCVDNDVEFDDVVATTDFGEWYKKIKATTPFGQLPMLKDGDFEVPQSNTILRYLGRKHGLHPEDVKESAKVDMINDHVEDIRVAYIQMIYQNYENGKDEFIKNLGTRLQPLEKLLKAWGNEFIVSKISFADYNLYDAIDNLEVLSPGCLDAYPTVKAYYEKIGKRPKIQKLRETAAFKEMTINGNGKQ